MIYYVKVASDGRVLNAGSVQEAAWAAHQKAVGPLIQVDTPVPDCNAVAWRDGKLVQLPPAPGPHHRFSYADMQWQPDTEAVWSKVRDSRDAKLAKTDWRVTKASEDGKPMSKAWKDYRQALRDITQQPDPFNIEWPVEPPG